jgi:hypothetical protein
VVTDYRWHGDTVRNRTGEAPGGKEPEFEDGSDRRKSIMTKTEQDQRHLDNAIIRAVLRSQAKWEVESHLKAGDVIEAIRGV